MCLEKSFVFRYNVSKYIQSYSVVMVVVGLSRLEIKRKLCT